MKTKTQHTSGPWEVTPTSKAGNGSAWRDIVSTGTEFSPSYVGEALERDAHLMAAAPELFAIVKQLADWEYDPDRFAGDLADLAVEARAAIAKAKGE